MKPLQESVTCSPAPPQASPSEQATGWLDGSLPEVQMLLLKGILHELSRLHSVVLASAELLLENRTPAAGTTCLSRSIVDAAERSAALTEVVEKCIHHASLPKGRCDLGQIVTKALRSFAEQTEPLGLDLYHTGTPLPTYIANPALFRELIDALLQNALDATSTSGAERPRIVLETCIEDSALAVHVHDNGPGCSAEACARIFESTFAYNVPASGRGMGLAFSRLIVEVHGGTVEAMNAEDGGGLITVRLPLEQGCAGA